jgi:hypothetical protein
MNPNFELDEVDPILMQYFDLLRSTPQRDATAAEASRSKFFAELNALFPVTVPLVETAPRARPAPSFERRKAQRPARGFAMPSFAYAFVAILTLLILFTGGIITARAAEYTLPGDGLYAVKIGLEQARLAFTFRPEQEVNLYMEYADRRLNEAKALVEIGRVEDAETMLMELQVYVQKANNLQRLVSEKDTRRGAILRHRIENRVVGFAHVLVQLSAAAPTTLQPLVENAVDSWTGMFPSDDGSSILDRKPTGEDDGDSDDNLDNNGNGNPQGGGNGNDNSNTNSAPGNSGNSNGSANRGNSNNNGNPGGNDNSNDNNGNGRGNSDRGNDNPGKGKNDNDKGNNKGGKNKNK